MVRSLAWFRQKANRDEVSHLDLTVETPTPAEGAVGCHDILIKVITLNCDIQMTATSFESKHLFSDASSKLPIFLIATNNNLLKPFVLLFFSLPPKKSTDFLAKSLPQYMGEFWWTWRAYPSRRCPDVSPGKHEDLMSLPSLEPAPKGPDSEAHPGDGSWWRIDVVYIYIRKKTRKKNVEILQKTWTIPFFDREKIIL